jgi:formylglycine-generating enzyme required for sulfatase activity/Mg-chelatase subunit ChlD
MRYLRWLLVCLMSIALAMPAVAEQAPASGDSPFAPAEKAREGTAYIFLIDISKSVSPKQFDQIKKGLSAWIEVLEEQDRMAILTFGNEVTVAQDFTGSRALLQSALDRLQLKASKTRLHAALLQSLELGKKEDAELPSKRVIILMSDGVDDFSGAMNREEVLQRVKKAKLPIFAVGFFNPPSTTEKEQALDALKRFADGSGGYFERADKKSFEEIYVEMRRRIRALKSPVATPAAAATPTPVSSGNLPISGTTGLDALMPRTVADNDIARSLWLLALILVLVAAGWVALRYLMATLAAHKPNAPVASGSASGASTLPRPPALAFIEYAGGVLEITTTPCTIGAVRDNDLVINHDSLSRYHATIEFRNGKFHVSDRDSTNGTRVGGKEVKQAELVEGCRLCFGSWEGVFHVGDPASLAKQRSRKPGLSLGLGANSNQKVLLAASAAMIVVLVSVSYLGYRVLFGERAGAVFAERLTNGNTGPEMVVIPAGKFFMGNISRNATGNPNELPVHELRVEAFALGRREVSFAEFDSFADATGRPRPDDSRLGRGQNPVFNVSWDEAVAYTEWLSQQTGQRYRLPTEAEWEYAARAGTGTEFAWGNEASREYANYGNDDCCTGQALGADRWIGPAPVASFPANAFGLYDMAGNVAEWTCSNYHEPYSGKEQTCAEARDDLPKVFRGGSWLTSWRFMRPATRLSTKPTDKHNYLGFRVARDL